MGAINQVIGGTYQGKKIVKTKNGMFIGDVAINKETVEHFEVMNEESNTTSYTTGKTKKSMVRAGAKGTVGAAIGTIIAPGIGTLIGAGAGVATSKGKNKSVTKEVTNKEFTVAINFSNREQSLVKMDGEMYEAFLVGAFSDPSPSTPLVSQNQVNNTKNNYLIWKVLGWLFIPYIMTLAYWRTSKAN
jgi:hypothetical protein